MTVEEDEGGQLDRGHLHEEDHAEAAAGLPAPARTGGSAPGPRAAAGRRHPVPPATGPAARLPGRASPMLAIEAMEGPNDLH